MYKRQDLYFERHDGQAVTCDDFVAAMGDAAGFDFSRFMTWYSQSGTPKVISRGDYDADARRYTLMLTQSCAPTPDQPQKAPYLIPVAVGLVAPTGDDLDLGSNGTADANKGEFTRVLHLTEADQVFNFCLLYTSRCV